MATAAKSHYHRNRSLLTFNDEVHMVSMLTISMEDFVCTGLADDWRHLINNTLSVEDRLVLDEQMRVVVFR
jgi:hypothetical protein